MIPYSRQFIDNEEIEAVLKVLKSDYLTQGPQVEKFENKVCKILNCKNAIAVNSATSALHIACLSIGLKKNDIVWTTPNSFVASSNCALYCDAKINFVDIDDSTFNISIIELKKKLKLAKKNNKLPKVIIYVHLAGNPADQKSIFELSKKYKFKIIEDASHAFGSINDKEKIGSCKYSDITVFSFHPVKIITTAEGGIATTNNSIYAKKMRLYSSHGISKDSNDFKRKKITPWHYEQQLLGYNYRMSEIHAALGISQLKKYKKFVTLRNELMNEYKFYLKDVEDIKFQYVNKNCLSSYHLCIVNFSREHLNERVYNNLKKNKFSSNLHYQPIHLQPYYKKLGFKKGDYPISEKYAKTSLSLPLFPFLKRKNISIISKILKNTVR